MGEIRSSYKILVEKSDGRSLLERTRPRLEDNIKMNFRKLECEYVVIIVVVNLWLP
jgi:hypothetical protein